MLGKAHMGTKASFASLFVGSSFLKGVSSESLCSAFAVSGS